MKERSRKTPARHSGRSKITCWIRNLSDARIGVFGKITNALGRPSRLEVVSRGCTVLDERSLRLEKEATGNEGVELSAFCFGKTHLPFMSSSRTTEETGPVLSSPLPSLVSKDERLEALRRYHILDTEPEPAFDNIAELAAHLFGASVGIVNFIADDRQWFKSAIGMDIQETGLEGSFCVYTIDKGEPFVVEDLSQSDKFAEYPFVKENGYKFYVGAPITTPDGHQIGTVCALDTDPQHPCQDVCDRLESLAMMVINELELRRENAKRKQVEGALRRSRKEYRTLFENAGDALLVHDAEGVIRNANKKARSLFRRQKEGLVGTTMFDLHPSDQQQVPRRVLQALRDGRDYDVVTEYVRPSGENFWGHLTASTVEIGGEPVMRSTIRDVTHQRRTDRLQNMQTHLFEEIATGTDREAVLRQLAHFIETEIPDSAVCLTECEDDTIYCVASPSLPEQYVEFVNGLEIGPMAGTCGAAVYEGREVETEDIIHDPRWEGIRDAADEVGLRACWSTPIQSEGETLGTIAVYGYEPRRLSHDQKELLRTLSSVAGVAIEKSQRQSRLRHHRELLAHVQHLAQVGGWEYDVEDNTLEVTDQTYRIHGLPVGSRVDVSQALTFYEPEFRPILQSNLDRLLGEGGKCDLELPFVTDEGERRWVRTIGEAHREEGTTTRLTGAIQDVTHQHRAQSKLKKQKEMLRTVIDNVPVMIALFDEDGEPQLVNKQAEQILGWSQEEVAEMPDFLKTLIPDPVPRRESILFARDPSVEWKEFRFQTKNEGRIPVRSTVVPLADDRRIGIGFDVSTEKTQEHRLQWAQRVANLGYWALDIETDEILWSTETHRIFGWPEEKDVTYKAFMEAVHPEDRARLREAQKAVKAGEEDINVQYRIRRPSGEQRTVHERGELRRDRYGRPFALMGAVLDVTKQARQREELKAAKQEAEEADRIKSALLSNMNHEFRTPLTSIISFSKLIRDTPDLAGDFAERILGGGKRLLRTLNTVMDFAELEGGQLSPTPQVVEVEKVLQSVANNFQTKADRKNLSLRVERAGEPFTVTVDPYYIERICMHLMSNAVKFTDEGSVIASVQEQEERLAVSISDTGIGIPPDFLPHVFDEFAQASSGYDRTHEGNGLGLTIAKRLAERLGGAIQIESEEGEGTRATALLPFETLPEKPTSGSDAPHSSESPSGS